MSGDRGAQNTSRLTIFDHAQVIFSRHHAGKMKKWFVQKYKHISQNKRFIALLLFAIFGIALLKSSDIFSGEAAQYSMLRQYSGKPNIILNPSRTDDNTLAESEPISSEDVVLLEQSQTQGPNSQLETNLQEKEVNKPLLTNDEFSHTIPASRISKDIEISESLKPLESTTRTHTVQVDKSTSALYSHPEDLALRNALSYESMSTSRCDQTFGPGFSPSVDVCDGAFTCMRNKISESAMCHMRNFQVNTDRIHVSAGNEPIDSVQRRPESDEYCKYEQGSFAISGCNENIIDSISSRREAVQRILPFHFKDIVYAMSYSSSEAKCTSTVETPTLFITRYEFANLYHTMTDLYNAYQTVRMYGLSRVNIVFLDGHSAGAMDNLWVTLFKTTPQYVSTVSSGTCFKNAYAVSPGYASSLWIKTMEHSTCPKSPYVKDFSRFVLESYGLDATLQKPAFSGSVVQILLVLRRPYASHPRMVPRQITRQMANSDDILKALKGLCNVNVTVVSFEKMTLLEQLRAVNSADIVVGIHGAGMSHVLFTRPNAGVVEVKPSGMSEHNHFKLFSAYRGDVQYRFTGASSDKPSIGVTAPVEQVTRVVDDLLRANTPHVCS